MSSSGFSFLHNPTSLSLSSRSKVTRYYLIPTRVPWSRERSSNELRTVFARLTLLGIGTNETDGSYRVEVLSRLLTGHHGSLP